MNQKAPFSLNYEQETRENSLTSFGGVPVFLEFIKPLGFDELINKYFPAKGDQGYTPFQYISSLVLLNLTGGESVSDIDRLEEDSGLKRVWRQLEKTVFNLKNRTFKKGRERIFPSPTRIFAFLHQFNSDKENEERESTPKGKSKILPLDSSFQGFIDTNREIVQKAQKLSPQKTATLDIDNNLVISQKETAKVSYKKSPSYGPMNVYWHEQYLMIHSEFRDGNVPPGYEQERIFKESLDLLPSSVEQVFHRSDSAGYQHEFLEFLDSGKSRFGKIEFAVSSNVSASFRKAVLEVPQEDWRPVTYINNKGFEEKTNQEVAEIVFIPSTKNHSKTAPVFRYLATREAVNIQTQINDEGLLTYMTSEYVEQKLHLEQMDEKVYKVFGVVTNRTETPLEILLWHRKRCGQSEEEHSRLTQDMAGGRFPSQSFGENAAWWMISILTQNLLKLFQQHTLPEELKRSRIKKLNSLMFRIAVKVVKENRTIKIRIGKDLPLFNLVKYAQAKIEEVFRKLYPILTG